MTSDEYDRGFEAGRDSVQRDIDEALGDVNAAKVALLESAREICDRVESDRILGITYPREAEYIASHIDLMIRKLDQ